MVHIKLTDDYFLLSEKNCWIIAKSDGTRLHNLYFYSSMEEAILGIFELKLKASNAKSISALLDYNKCLRTALCKALQPLQIRIEPISEVKNEPRN